MSYCRFGEEGSEVYMYLGVKIVCCACLLQPIQRIEATTGSYGIHEDKEFDTIGAAIAHLNVHERAGHKVPKKAYTRLIEDMVGEDDMTPRSQPNGR